MVQCVQQKDIGNFYQKFDFYYWVLSPLSNICLITLNVVFVGVFEITDHECDQCVKKHNF